MPVFSIIIIIILGYFILIDKSERTTKFYQIFSVDCVVKLFFLQGYFVKIGNTEVSTAGDVCDLVLLWYAILIIIGKRNILQNKVCIRGIIFLLVSMLGIFVEIIMPYEGLLMPAQDETENWDMYVAGMCTMHQYFPTIIDYTNPIRHLVTYVVILVAFKTIFQYDMFLRAYMSILKYVKYGIYYGWIEFIVKNVIGNTTVTYLFSGVMFGVNERSIATEAFKRGETFFALQGFCKEPSHFNVFIFSAVSLMILGIFIKRFLRHNNIKADIHMTYGISTIISGVVLLSLTGGFSAVWLILIITFNTIALRFYEMDTSIMGIILMYKKTLFIGCLCISILVIVIGANDYFVGRIIDAISVLNFIGATGGGFLGLAVGGNQGIGSTIARFISLYEGVNIFISRPLLGLGYKLQAVHGDTLTYLINMGVIGFWMFYRLLISSIKEVKYNKLFMFITFFIGGLPMIMSAYGLCVYWLLFIEGSMLIVKQNIEKLYTEV